MKKSHKSVFILYASSMSQPARKKAIDREHQRTSVRWQLHKLN
jgi:hypothetical protein